ncbi:hypothetical protein DRJ16_06030, partial [Candidatus Woesearchaeota archaeon]
VTFDLNGNGVADAGDVGTLEGVPDTSTEGASPISVSVGMTIPETTEGKYFQDVNGNGKLDTGEFYVFIDHAEISGDVILNTAEQDSIVGKSVPTSAEIVFKIETNIGNKIPNARVDIKVYDPDGVEVTTIDGQALNDVTILGTTMFVGNPAPTTTAPPYTAPAHGLRITDLDTGTYKVKFVLDKTSCNMLDVSSPEYTFTVRSEELKIEAVEDVVGKGEDMSVIIQGNPKTYYYVTVTGVDVREPPAIKMAGDVKARDEDPRGPDGIFGTADDIADGAAYPGADNAPNTADDIPYLAAWVRTGNDGIAEVKIDTTAADERTYTIHVYEVPVPNAAGLTPPPAATFLPDKALGPNNDVNDVATDDDDVDITVEEAEVTFDMPNKAVIGSDVTIKGAISAGKYVDIVIEDANVVFDDVAVDENNEFEEKWDTSGLTTGSYTIDVYIDRADALGTEVPLGINGILDPSDYEGIDEDGSTTIRLVKPDLTAKQLRNLVAEGDDYTIEGTATGVDEVDIVLIGPKGYSRPAAAPFLDVLNGLEVISTSVTDDEYSEDITMTENLDTGIWKVLVLSPGRDGTYGDLGVGAGDLDNGIDNIDGVANNYAEFAGKDQDQIVAMIMDHTVNVAGSDDIMKTFTFKVESGRVELNPVEPVPVGEPLNISGVTNREPGTTITISTFAGPTELPAAIVEVEWPTPDEGVFKATIDTTDAVPGTYTLEADDGDGHTDTVTVEIKAAVPSPTPSPSPTVSPTPSPTPTPTPTPSPTVSPVAPTTPTPTPSPSPSPTPGFEAIFAVAGLLAVTYFVLRRKK